MKFLKHYDMFKKLLVHSSMFESTEACLRSFENILAFSGNSSLFEMFREHSRIFRSCNNICARLRTFHLNAFENVLERLNMFEKIREHSSISEYLIEHSSMVDV